MELVSILLIIGVSLEAALLGGAYFVGWYDGKQADKEVTLRKW
ncbi:MAG: hypothetical protein PHH57_07575 [Candidatus Omnitrophica bacterium]|nr:hypothetical protein [Candidatus Omnitrophota bacterium]